MDQAHSNRLVTTGNLLVTRAPPSPPPSLTRTTFHSNVPPAHLIAACAQVPSGSVLPPVRTTVPRSRPSMRCVSGELSPLRVRTGSPAHKLSSDLTQCQMSINNATARFNQPMKPLDALTRVTIASAMVTFTLLPDSKLTTKPQLASTIFFPMVSLLLMLTILAPSPVLLIASKELTQPPNSPSNASAMTGSPSPLFPK